LADTTKLVDTTRISGPIEIKDNSKERVAFDLFKAIGHLDAAKQDQLLELYARCLITTKNPELGVAEVKQRAKGSQ
jgi:hypothetical protein